MNRINMELVKTVYSYGEHYWVIDGRPVVQYVDEAVMEGRCPGLKAFGSLLGLMPAWTGELEWKADNQFVWEMIDAPETLNIPILVCEDDCDLSCIVILAKIRKTGRFVYWDKLGLLKRENENFDLEKKSGILCLEAYTDEDWAKYGDNIACVKFDSNEYWEWVSEHWDEELIRRRRNYTKPYMQKDENIDWFLESGWIFDRTEYEQMAKAYRAIYKKADLETKEERAHNQ
ncbi:XRE family transcriptional regulator [Clostridium sp. AM58-1XD]|uniref:XRE family transcriptional regulator n=1 Tax=Clostridium sp. AM58-1XD TaxID=2292307 RepID=UPI000E4B78F4|nr:XRE family transcriptional regulator [Clostridium sp. AM58-1XD]RGZ00439.1 XRE family transcriptional regulator [Clostridium sp. AM58-1XD]